MLEWVRKVAGELVELARGFRRAMLEESVSALEEEYVELESVFLSMLLGPLIGVKTATPLLSLELLDSLSPAEMRLLESRALKGEDVLGDLFSALGGEW